MNTGERSQVQPSNQLIVASNVAKPVISSQHEIIAQVQAQKAVNIEAWEWTILVTPATDPKEPLE